MINSQFSKCPVCGKDEKFVAFIKVGKATIEVRTCAKKCMIAPEDK